MPSVKALFRRTNTKETATQTIRRNSQVRLFSSGTTNSWWVWGWAVPIHRRTSSCFGGSFQVGCSLKTETMPLTCLPAPVCHSVSKRAFLLSQIPKILLLSRSQVLLQCVRMVTVAVLWSSCPWWSGSWPVIFSSHCIHLEYIAILKRFLWCSVSLHQTDHHHFHLLLFMVLWRIFLLQLCQAQSPPAIDPCYLSGLTRADTFSPCPGLPPFITQFTKSFLHVFLSSPLTAQCATQSLFCIAFYLLIYHAVAIICRVAFHHIISKWDAFVFSLVTAQKAPLNSWFVSQEVYHQTNNIPR